MFSILTPAEMDIVGVERSFSKGKYLFTSCGNEGKEGRDGEGREGERGAEGGKQ